MLIDSHAHLDYEYEHSTEELLRQAADMGVKTVIAIAAAAPSLHKVRELAERFPNVYFTSGIHPHDSGDFNGEIFSLIKTLATHPKCVAVGELGLDYFYHHASQQLQFQALEAQLAFSAEIGKPVVVHTRDADADTIRFLETHSKEFLRRHPGKIPGVIHCFTGSANLAEACLQLGYFISFSGIITFKNAEDLRNVVQNIVPLEKMLVETDSPFLTPAPHRGKKNQPGYTRLVAEKVAELKNVTLATVAQTTKANTRQLFSLPEIPD